MQEFSDINIKQQLKNKTEIDYNSLTFEQLRAYYYWKKDRENIKDVFEAFIPDDDAIRLIQQSKLPDSFYHFKISIPTIQIK